MSNKNSAILLGAITLLLLYVGIMVAELVATTPWLLYVRNDLGLPLTLFRIMVESLTTLPLAYLTGSLVIRWSPTLSRTAMFGAGIALTLIIGTFQLTIYEPEVWSASLLKVLFPIGGLWLAHATRRRGLAAEGSSSR